ncbi:MAG: ribosome maturation factor RimM [Gilvibacter sp.]
MRKEDCFFLGKIVKKYSFKGELLATLDTDSPELYTEMESVLVQQHERLIPFFIESSSLHKSRLLRIQFEDVYDEATAESLIGSELYLPLAMLPKLSGDNFYYHEIIGFTVIDSAHGEVGIIKAVNDQTAQALFVIDREGTEILIPINDQFVKKLDRKKREIHLETPEGLIDIYL